MQYIKQDFYDKFVCSADKCPDNCCHEGWQIVVDEDSLERFKNYDGPLKKKIEAGVDFDEGVINFDSEGHCPMLNKDGLCELVLEMGEESLCTTCHMYPRHIEEYDGLRELSISISCPLGAKMTIEREEPMGFVEVNDDEPEPLEDDFDDFDYLLFDRLIESREKIYNVLKDRNKGILYRIATVIDYADSLQKCIDDDCIFDMDDIEPGEEGDFDMHRFILKHGGFLKSLERLRQDWNDYLEYLDKVMLLSPAEFEDEYVQYVNCFGESVHDRMLENILMSLIFTYYPGAVYDDMLSAKVMLCVFNAVMIDGISFGMYLSTKEATVESFETVTYKFAREIEHSDENLNAVEDYFG